MSVKRLTNTVRACLTPPSGQGATYCRPQISYLTPPSLLPNRLYSTHIAQPTEEEQECRRIITQLSDEEAEAHGKYLGNQAAYWLMRAELIKRFKAMDIHRVVIFDDGKFIKSFRYRCEAMQYMSMYLL